MDGFIVSKLGQLIPNHVCKVFRKLNLNKMLLNACLNKHWRIDKQECDIYLGNISHHFQLIQHIDQICIRINRYNKGSL
jgi:hypothetical protein